MITPHNVFVAGIWSYVVKKSKLVFDAYVFICKNLDFVSCSSTENKTKHKALSVPFFIKYCQPRNTYQHHIYE